MVNVAGSANTVLQVEYSIDSGGSWLNLSAQLDVDATGVAPGTWANIPVSAKTDVLVRLVGSGGDGVADPEFSQVALEVR